MNPLTHRFSLDFNHIDDSTGYLELPFNNEGIWPPSKSYSLTFWMKIEPKLENPKSNYVLNLAEFESSVPAESILRW